MLTTSSTSAQLPLRHYCATGYPNVVRCIYAIADHPDAVLISVTADSVCIGLACRYIVAYRASSKVTFEELR